MHKELKELLHSAKGQSRHVVVIFLDVRGFSSFAGMAESTDTAEFLKSAYITILDEYFPEADFFKPTGDGLVVLYGYDREGLTDAVRTAAGRSIRLVEAFPTICANDPMVNFDVPTHLGIGLSRGAATALTAGDKVLDFSGRPLNLASRLMDLARPSGVVFDSTFGIELLTEEMQARFAQETAYIKGIAEDKPLTVYCLKGYAEIPEFNKRPMGNFERFTEPEEEIPFKTFEERAPRYRHRLNREPARTDNIEVHLQFPKARSNGSRHPSMLQFLSLPAKYMQVAGKSYAQVDYSAKVAQMKELGVRPSWKVRSTIEYSIIPPGAS